MKLFCEIRKLSLASVIALASVSLVFALGGCASKTIADPSAQRSRIFPNGAYQHDVDLTMQIPAGVEAGGTDGAKASGANGMKASGAKAASDSNKSAASSNEKAQPRTVHFHGVVKITDDVINMVALSPLNSTLFRIHEDRRSGQVDTEIYVDALKKMKTQMTDFYGLIRLILTVPLDAEKHPEFHAREIAEGTDKGLVDQLSLQTDAGAAIVKFRDYDKDRIPETILVDNPKFNLVIKVSGYEL